MTDRATSTVINDNLLMSYFSRKAMMLLKVKVPLYSLADKFPLPRNSGKQFTANGWAAVGAASSQLSEYHASSNAAIAISSRKVNVTVLSLGRHAKISDLLDETGIISAVDGAVDVLTYSAALTLENTMQLAIFQGNGGSALGFVGGSGYATLLSAMISAHVSAFCSDTGTHATATNRRFGFPAVFGASATRLSAINASSASVSAMMGPIAVRKSLTALRRLGAEPFDGGMYALVVNMYAMAAMFANPLSREWYVNWSGGPQETFFPGEFRQPYMGCRVVLDPKLPYYRKAAATCALSANLSLIIGKGAIGVTELGGGVEVIIKRSGSQTTSDPYNQLITVAYKYRGAGMVLNPSAGRVIISVDHVKYTG